MAEGGAMTSTRREALVGEARGDQIVSVRCRWQSGEWRAQLDSILAFDTKFGGLCFAFAGAIKPDGHLAFNLRLQRGWYVMPLKIETKYSRGAALIEIFGICLESCSNMIDSPSSCVCRRWLSLLNVPLLTLLGPLPRQHRAETRSEVPQWSAPSTRQPPDNCAPLPAARTALQKNLLESLNRSVDRQTSGNLPLVCRSTETFRDLVTTG